MRWQDRVSCLLGEWQYNQAMYYYLHLSRLRMPKTLRLAKPRTFNEKTIWLKMHYRAAMASEFTDKVLAKGYVARLIGDRHLIPTLGVWDTVESIDFDSLPDSFVLKANHGSGWNIICRCKSDLNLSDTRRRLHAWLATNYYAIGKEYQYRDIAPRVLAEQFLDDTSEGPLTDYKLFCFDGEPYCVQVDLDRFTKHTRNFYDVNWNLLPFTTLYRLGTRRLRRPHALQEMIDVARVLSKGLPFARIDLYYHRRRVYFGEITLHHGGGFEPFIPEEWDRQLGDRIRLPAASV